MDTAEALAQKYLHLFPHMNSRQRGLVAAADAERIGRGGVTLVARASGLSRPTIYQAIRDLHQEPLPATPEKPVTGSKQAGERKPRIAQALQALIETTPPGEAGPVLSWTCQTTRQLAQRLGERGHTVSHEIVARLLRELGFRLPLSAGRVRRVPLAGREAQFRHVIEQTRRFAEHHWPVVVVEIDDRKPDTTSSPLAPLALAFTAQTVHSWWQSIGRVVFPGATHVLVCLDRMGPTEVFGPWKSGLQHWANQQQIELTICHLPPGTYRWNTAEFHLRQRFSLAHHDKEIVAGGVTVALLGKPGNLATGRSAGSDDFIRACVIAQEQTSLNSFPHETLGDWNYTLRPSPSV
jgi:transposase